MTFDAHAHPRATDGTFTEKTGSAAEVSLSDDPRAAELRELTTANWLAYREGQLALLSRVPDVLRAAVLRDYPTATGLMFRPDSEDGTGRSIDGFTAVGLYLYDDEEVLRFATDDPQEAEERTRIEQAMSDYMLDLVEDEEDFNNLAVQDQYGNWVITF